jgi:hypothetical protein
MACNLDSLLFRLFWRRPSLVVAALCNGPSFVIFLVVIIHDCRIAKVWFYLWYVNMAINMGNCRSLFSYSCAYVGYCQGLLCVWYTCMRDCQREYILCSVYTIYCQCSVWVQLYTLYYPFHLFTTCSGPVWPSSGGDYFAKLSHCHTLKLFIWSFLKFSKMFLKCFLKTQTFVVILLKLKLKLTLYSVSSSVMCVLCFLQLYSH